MQKFAIFLKDLLIRVVDTFTLSFPLGDINLSICRKKIKKTNSLREEVSEKWQYQNPDNGRQFQLSIPLSQPISTRRSPAFLCLLVRLH